MDLEYDRKFEEMKKYIPFLENMIKRLESTSMTSANPRQAQLDKIRSLRDLLLDKKKRMKMENLLKCEQVLVNLYAKVEQRDTHVSPKAEVGKNSKTKESSDLEVVRNKLKSVVRTTTEEGQETLPEIARASIIEETCTPGSKEPALFQRRPNKASKSPARITQKSPIKAANTVTPKRNYTRVLLSPEPGERHWDNDNKASEKLFSRRSPRRSPKRSPTYNKKERKKSSKQSQGKKSKDLNITLSVPEESLNSLNSKDILKRIMNCSDNDVDIKTLREAKRQILDELKQTGAKYDDISDLLLKSYENTGSGSKKIDDVEEGELSDSESEAIQSIYGNFILDDIDNSSKDKSSKTLEKPKKIQICLVINQDNANSEIQNALSRDTDANDFEMFDKKSLVNVKEDSQSSETANEHNIKQKEYLKVDGKGDDDVKKELILSPAKDKASESVEVKLDGQKINNVSAETSQVANFYKPLVEEKCDSNATVTASTSIDIKGNTTSSSSADNLPEIAAYLKDTENDKNDIEIPLLHDQSVATQKPKEDVVSEIDILQALKNEILSESLSIPGSESTPLMHQPKLTKVVSVQEIVPKKRISIEKYKKKSIPSTPTHNPLFVNDPTLSLLDDSTSSKEDSLKKQSLKLTEKECERFNFPTKLAFDDDDDYVGNELISDEDTPKDTPLNDTPLNDTYENLAPKSPDHIDSSECMSSLPPVIIPVDPVKTVLVPSKSDVDMRTLTPNVMVCSSSKIETKQDLLKNNVEKPKAPVDPRVRRDINQSSDKDHLAHSITLDPEKISQPVPPVVNYPNMVPNVTNMTQKRTLLMTPNMTPNMTPSRVSNMTPSMTPNRNPNMTPNARSFDITNRHKFDVDDNTVTKHVYAPTFPFYDHRESREQSVTNEQERRPLWDQIDKERENRRRDLRWDNVDNRDCNSKRDPRSGSVHRETSDYSKPRYGESFNKYDNYNSRFNDRRDSYNRSECPRTPLPSFGRSEAPSTPNHPFGRLDAPMTPVPSFGRTDCPSTPSHPFGRPECPSTPSHTFGRPDLTWNECPMTPSHSFGRMDVPTTPSHPFGRSESHSRDPRLNRTSEYDNFYKDDFGRNYSRDRNRLNYHNPHRSEPHQPDSYRNYREHSVSRNERNNYSENDTRRFNRDQPYKRESSIGRTTSRDYDDRSTSRDRSRDISRNDYHHKADNDPMRKGFVPERSVRRSMSIDNRRHQASSRASSVGRTVHVNDTRTSVQPDTGSSFVINTSVRSTFQDFLSDNKLEIFASSFDRQKRASSVGRTLHRESSAGRSLSNAVDSRHNIPDCSDRNNFRRARSVGRDILTSEKERTFKDLRADFEKFYNDNIKGDKYFDSKTSKKYDKHIHSSEPKNQSIIKNKNVYESSSKECSSKKPYSPRKNQRDPRMCRNLPNPKSKYVENEREKKHIGIVYSNDNIKKGTILGPGLGVKNYKIPKIKRPVEEVKEDKKKSNEKEAEVKKDVRKEEKKVEVKKNDKKELKDINRNDDKVSEKRDSIKKTNNKNKTLNQEKIETKQDSSKVKANAVKCNVDNEEKHEKRITRLSKKSETSLSIEDTISKVKKSKRPVLFDSDSDEDKTVSNAKESGKQNKALKVPIIETNQANKTVTKICTMGVDSIVDNISMEISNDEETSDEVITDNLESNFAIDDLGIFSDNLASDPVIDNINAIIADLDNDLDSSKIATTKFSNDISFENMLGTFDSDKEKTANTITENLNDISEVINNDLNQSVDSNKIDTLKSVSVEKQNSDAIQHTSSAPQSEGLAFESSEITGQNSVQCEQPVKDDTVSTTEINKEAILETTEEPDKTLLEANSVPDSTNEANPQKLNSGDSLPDSTNEVNVDGNSLVTSSHDSLEVSNKDNVGPSLSNKEVSPMNSIGNILSLLQDKSKLKEILNLLGDQTSENEKIKRKLEKLSEIVLDEDDEVEKTNPNEKTTLDVSVESCNKSNDKESITDEPLKVDIDSTNNSNELSADVNLQSTDDVNLQQPDENKTNTVESNILESTTENDVNEMSITKKENIQVPKKLPIKKGASSKKGRGKTAKNTASKGIKRITRSTNVNVKKPSRELLKLQEDLKEMFISDEVLNATGIRMCRLAKLVNDNTPKSKEDPNTNDSAPLVVLEKSKDMETADEVKPSVKYRKKPGPKPKPKPEDIIENKTNKIKSFKYKPGPKSKTKHIQKSEDDDPYAFESDSVSENNYSMKSADGKEPHSSDSESDSISSSQSFGSTDLLVEVKKKPKRKRSAWQSGVIKSKSRKKKSEANQKAELLLNEDVLVPEKTKLPDNNCFTDKSYCFFKNVFSYSCRLCIYSGEDIVNHYKQQHPHSEIPLSRISPEMAKEAIEQCEEVNFQSISKIPTDKYVCRFCFKEFTRKKAALEAFFWHIVSMHTGEYKHSCTLCESDAKCPFNLDIPPPPKEIKGQLIGYICEKCNFTQISLENLKTHVIVRHNDEQTEVYTINLAVMSKKAIKALMKSTINEPEKPRVLRSSRSNQSMTETSDDHSDDVTDSDQSSEPLSAIKKSKPPVGEHHEKVNIQSKIAFENDDNATEASSSSVILNSVVKKETIEEEIGNNKEIEVLRNNLISEICGTGSVSNKMSNENEIAENSVPEDINDYAHFKITFTDSGSKEYVCCINGIDNHYQTTLLISMKKHVQCKHSEIWDGYCFICKVIVTPQGKHKFKDCFQHYLDKHMDNFPVLEKITAQTEENQDSAPSEVQSSLTKPYINVRPMSELMSKEINMPSALTPLPPTAELPPMPKIENIMSLGAQTVEPSQASPSYPPVLTEPPKEDDRQYKYEEVQAEVMSKKHRVVLDTMMSYPKLVNVFKCAGSYCSFTCDSAEQALLHASTHQRVGGDNSLICSYCDFDCSGNAIDLVMHVFKAHRPCPYACGYCFYRATASQLVMAHISRIHKDVQPKILSLANVPPPQTKDSSMLSREDVVLYYICGHACKFRAYTAGRFCEHLMQQHAAELSHPCYLCTEKQPSPQRLIQHMKCHQVNVYQCTWCLHGADSEAALLLHAAHRHPHKQPQAYLRVITNKDGSSQLRVLPLVSFNKSKVAVEIVTATTNENPVKEAERSIDLEKLIGHVIMPTHSATSGPNETTAEPPTETESAVTSIIEDNLADVSQQNSAAAIIDPVSVSTPQRPVTPATTQEISEQVTPKIKSEPTDETPRKALPTDIVCLDSDDENSRDSRDSRLSIIALSDDETSAPDSPSKSKEGPKYRIIPWSYLLTCPVCLLTYKSVAGFKRHTNTCTPTGSWTCAHCEMTVKGRDDLVIHYLKDHKKDKNANVCDLCKERFPNVALAKIHLKYVHGVTKTMVWKNENDEKEFECIVGANNSKTSGPKRKRSSSGAEPPAKLKRFGPRDVDLLPINPILDEPVSCSLCEFKTKVRLNMVRHLQLHAEQQPVPQTAPINPVPHLETNEKHFDKMVNLASSSIVNRAPEKQSRSEGNPNVSVLIPPEAASRYPRYVPDRQRHTCGAKGCAYISVDEAMLRCHWETLHSGSNDFHCVHCPPYQHLDTSKPLTAARIIAHLKMHDATLYACSSCSYYHYRKQVLEKHVSEVHKGAGRIMVVREEVIPTPNTGQAAPTMDLKPWQCGICNFKSMLRPEVVEHCSKSHQSKMQFKCYYCPFRTSTVENVTKHQTNVHPMKSPEIFYFYYREGSIPDEVDGTPRWVRQRQKFAPTDPEVKSEVADSTYLSQLLSKPIQPVLDLNIVKKEVEDSADQLTIDQLLNKYGQSCEPNGLRFKCPLCKVVTEDEKEAMKSHLYEELKYRRWACKICSYKAFHKNGLNDHIVQEHRGVEVQEPTQLPLDINIERWVTHILEHQSTSINKTKANLAKQKILTEKPIPSTSTAKPASVTEKVIDKYSMKDLELAFGKLGVPSNMLFSCPKCDFKVKEESSMRDHLEGELTKIRWSCSSCAENFQTYHEAQFHCKSVHTVGISRPIEAIREPSMRTAWVQGVLRVQRLTMNCQPSNPTPNHPPPPQEVDNSLLVVRYEETITPTELVPRKRPAESPSPSEVEPKRKVGGSCPYCPFKTRYNHVLREHQLRHYDLKPFSCTFCDFNGTRNLVSAHLQSNHDFVYKPEYVKQTPMPNVPPRFPNLSTKPKTIKPADENDAKMWCLICERNVRESEVATHAHDDGTKPEIGKKGDVVVKCCLCMALRVDYSSLIEHHKASHPDKSVNYAFFKLFHDTRELLACSRCDKKFKYIKDLKSHHNATHDPSSMLIYNIVPYSAPADSDEEELKICEEPKRVARKSTTKLPAQMVAKKSTTKLPYDFTDGYYEYSYYGTKAPSPDRYENVTTLMSFYNTMVPFTLKKLTEVIDINPTVVVEDCKKKIIPEIL